MLFTGIDIEDIKRFENKTLENDSKFLKRIFTDKELEYCFSCYSPAEHLAARFCAKEAFIKAISCALNRKVPYSKIEILKNKNNSPYINLIDNNDFEFNISLSLSHEKNKAIAFVILYEK